MMLTKILRALVLFICCGTLYACFNWDTPAGANLACSDGETKTCPEGWSCEDGTCISLNCGDGVQDPLEECDWGKNNSNTLIDACRENCTEPTCGDGVVDSNEACDDGNRIDDGNGCSETCERVGFCGDNEIQSAVESCEDGNEVNGDGCSSNCITEQGYTLILPGSFTMGDDLLAGSAPRTVNIKHSFFIMTHEVTQGEWYDLMGTKPSEYKQCHEGCDACKTDTKPCPDECWRDCPVENITWFDAIDYSNQLSTAVGLTPCYTLTTTTATFEPVVIEFPDIECSGYRLPTEAEWEYAVRAGTNTPYYTGANQDGLSSTECTENTDLASIGWYCHNSNEVVQAVGQKDPNPWGLYDMNGNVAEWVWDWYNSFVPDDMGIIRDDKGNEYDPDEIRGPETGDDRVKKGGDKNSYPIDARSVSRLPHSPNGKYNGLGLRVVRTAP